jgi:hypothetical protein
VACLPRDTIGASCDKRTTQLERLVRIGGGKVGGKPPVSSRHPSVASITVAAYSWREELHEHAHELSSQLLGLSHHFEYEAARARCGLIRASSAPLEEHA